ncbi:hypothetical protein H4K38_10790 [Streptomyces sp. I3(2020)]|nr:hypothetical protein [Streptomyces sp. I3(2020)]
MTRFDVLVAGGSGADTLVRVHELSLPPGSSVRMPPIGDHMTHTGKGVTLGLYALGARTMFLHVGDNEPGQLIRDRYREAGLVFTGVPALAGTPAA